MWGEGCENRGRLRCSAASIGYVEPIRKGSVHSKRIRLSALKTVKQEISQAVIKTSSHPGKRVATAKTVIMPGKRVTGDSRAECEPGPVALSR